MVQRLARQHMRGGEFSLAACTAFPLGGGSVREMRRTPRRVLPAGQWLLNQLVCLKSRSTGGAVYCFSISVIGFSYSRQFSKSNLGGG